MKHKWLIAGALILAEIGLCGAMIAAVVSTVGLFNLDRIEFGGFVSDRVSVTTDEEKKFTVNGPATINVNQDNDLAAFGDITVIGGSGDEIVVTAHKTAWGADTNAAQTDLDKLDVIITQTGDVINLHVERPEQIVTVGSSRPDTVDFTITVPIETSVNLSTDFGDISASGLEGTVQIDTEFGDVSITNVTGPRVEARSSFGEITLEKISADEVDAQSNAGEIRLTAVNASGNVLLDTDFGSINFEDGAAQSLTAQTNSGEVQLTSLKIKESVEARSDFGGVTLTDVIANSYDLRSNSGGLTLNGAAGLVTLKTDFGDIAITKAEDVTLNLQTNSGSIDFAGSLGAGPHTIRTDFGPIHLQLPKTSKLTVDLETDFGRIKSDLPITLTGDQENDHWTGEINNGGESLTAKTNSGEITIESLNP